MLGRTARLTGAMYIPYLAFGIPLFLRVRLIVPNDAAATAANILSSESLYRITVITDLVSYGLYIVLAYLFYLLLRGVSRPWAAVATLLTLAGCVVLISASALLTAPLLLLHEPAHAQHLAANALQVFIEAARDMVTEIRCFHQFASPALG